MDCVWTRHRLIIGADPDQMFLAGSFGSPFGELYAQLTGKPWEIRGARAVRNLDPLWPGGG